MSPFNDLLCPLLLGASGWSPDLTRAVLDLPAGAPRGFFMEPECGNPEPRLVPGESEHFRNLFVRDNLSRSFSLVNLTPSTVVWPEPEEFLQRYWPASFLAGSDDLSHVVFEEELKLTEDAPVGYPEGDELYEWVDGEVRLVTVLPNETAVHGALAGATRNYTAAPGIVDSGVNIAQARHAVSSDGSRVFFEAPGDEGEGELYLREDGESTVQVDAAEAGAQDSSGGGDFQAASADGSRVFFTSDHKLTIDSTTGVGKPDLYEYDSETGDLTDLTVNATEAAKVLGVSGASEDGSQVYFVAEGVLSTDTNSEGGSATAGQPNLYVVDRGAIRFIATLDPAADECDWTWNARCGGGTGGSGITARVSVNGRYIGFNSARSLTGYENKHPESEEPLLEIYVYDAVTDKLVCASCDPTGDPPLSGAAIHWPSGPGKNNNWRNAYHPQRNLSENGHVFFETADALLPRDTNGRRDVYQYADGELSLISSGTGESGSHFLDATPDGSSVFFSTAQRLLPRDTDTVYDYYVARIGGGFPEPSPPAPPCEGDSCRTVGAAAPGIAPVTNAFRGRGNLRPHGSCRAFGHRAKRLRRNARKLARNARKLARNGQSRQASQATKKGRRIAKRAHRLSGHAKRCRRANRRAGR